MSFKTWRDAARSVIVPLIDELGIDHPELRKRLSAAYPFGERKYHPYKIWLSEVKHQIEFRAKVKQMSIDQLPLFKDYNR